MPQGVQTADRDASIPEVTDLGVLGLELGEGLVGVSVELANARVSRIRSPITPKQLLNQAVPLDLGVEHLQHPVNSSAVGRSLTVPEGIHVLL